MYTFCPAAVVRPARFLLRKLRASENTKIINIILNTSIKYRSYRPLNCIINKVYNIIIGILRRRRCRPKFKYGFYGQSFRRD